MIVWVDAQLSPALAPWLTQEFGIVHAKDREIFQVAREANAVVLTKDADFTLWLGRLGPPPRILWLRCGNTSNAYLKKLLRKTLPPALEMIDSGETLVEIADLP